VCCFSGNLTIFANGTLSVANGAEIFVDGCISLGGTLEVTLTEEVQNGQTLPILTSKSGCINGTFDRINVKHDGCKVVTATQDVSASGNKLSVVFQTRDDNCGLSAAAIGGIVAGVLIFVIAVILVTVAIYVPTVRKAVFPYRRPIKLKEDKLDEGDKLDEMDN